MSESEYNDPADIERTADDALATPIFYVGFGEVGPETGERLTELTTARGMYLTVAYRGHELERGDYLPLSEGGGEDRATALARYRNRYLNAILNLKSTVIPTEFGDSLVPSAEMFGIVCATELSAQRPHRIRRTLVAGGALATRYFTGKYNPGVNIDVIDIADLAAYIGSGAVAGINIAGLVQDFKRKKIERNITQMSVSSDEDSRELRTKMREILREFEVVAEESEKEIKRGRQRDMGAVLGAILLP